MFRYRNKLGEDLALEGLKNYVASADADLYQLRHYAHLCQVKTVILPLSESIGKLTMNNIQPKNLITSIQDRLK